MSSFDLCAGSAMSPPNDLGPLRVGVAGLVHDHVRFLDLLPLGEIEIVGVQEADDSLLQDFLTTKHLSAGHGYASLEAMLSATRPTAVTSFGPTSDHLRVVQACAPLGIHVIVEKPLAIDIAAAKEIMRLAQAHKIQVLTSYETSWYASTHEMIALNDRGDYGPLHKMIFFHGNSGPEQIGVSLPFLAWLTDAKQNGAGALFDFGCYGANLATRLAGDRVPVSITSVTRHLKAGPAASVDDDATILIEYADMHAVILASWAWPVSRKDVELYGLAGEVKLYDRRELQLRSNDPERRSRVVETPPPPFANVFSQLTSLISGDSQLALNDLSGLPNNLHVVRILEGARISAATGGPVSWESLL